MKPSKKPASRPKKKTSARPKTGPKKKPAAKKRPLKAKKAAPLGDQLGKVVAFFRIPVVAVIKVTKGILKAGDQIWIKGHTTDLKQTVTSMQVNHQPIQKARKGDEVGLKISSRARRGDRVYRI
jgi:putative protease